MADQEHLLRGRPVGDAHEVGVRVAEVQEDRVDVVGEVGRGGEAQVAFYAVYAGLDGRAERGRVGPIGKGGQVMAVCPVPRCSMKTKSRSTLLGARSGRTRLMVSTAESPGPPANQTTGSSW
jgi:hypothetical protein